MLISKNSLQNIFLIVLGTTVSINASVNPLMTQISSIGFIIFFLICLKNKKVLEKMSENYQKNKIFFIFFFI